MTTKKLIKLKSKTKISPLLATLVGVGILAGLVFLNYQTRNKNISPLSPESDPDAFTAQCTLNLSIKPPVCKDLDIAIVIDRSSTMTTLVEGKQKLYYAREAAKTLVTTLKNSGSTSVNVAVSSFGAQGNDGTGELSSEYNSTLNSSLKNVAANYTSLITALNGVIYKKPGTCVQCGIRIGNAQLTDTSNRRVLLLLSDGKANHVWEGDASNSVSIARAIEESNIGRSRGIEYRVVGYGLRETNQIDETTLRSIAGGSENYTYSPIATGWTQTFSEILTELCQ
jgi:hypothetical protein